MSREEQAILKLSSVAPEPLFSRLPNSALVRLSETCRSFRDSTFKQRKLHQHNELIRQVVYGEKAKAKAMLENNPSLLLGTGEAIDYARRTIVDTPFKAALRAGDEQMCQMIMAIAQLNHMEDKLQTQFESIFPDGMSMIAFSKKQQENAFNFIPIVTAISNASLADCLAALDKKGLRLTETEAARAKADSELTLVEALNRFRDQFAKLSREETIFNPYHLSEAFKRYDIEFPQWEWKQRDLFWRQVIGYIQCFLPACYINTLAFVGGTITYPPKFDETSGLGFDEAFAWGNCTTAYLVPRAQLPLGSCRVYFDSILQEKQHELAKIESASGCATSLSPRPTLSTL